MFTYVVIKLCTSPINFVTTIMELDSSSNLIKYLESLDNVSMSILFHEVEVPDALSCVNNKFTISNYYSESPSLLSSTENYLHNLDGERNTRT